MSDREVMQQALKALEAGPDVDPIFAGETEAALRARLAEPKRGPVAWGLFAKVGGGEFVLQHPVRFSEEDAENDRSMYQSDTVIEIRPLYEHPPARRPLTDEEIDRVIDVNWSINNYKPTYVAHRAFARAVERAHKIGGNDE
jgi:hypothetical protein